jgi:VCBS repeat-containing protein
MPSTTRRWLSTTTTRPWAVSDTYSTDEDTALSVAAPGVLGNDSVVDGNALTAVLVSGPASGTLTLDAEGSFTYTPNPNFNGSDSFTYKANDGTTNSNVATVTITVNAVNAPVAVNDAYSTAQNTTLNVAAPEVLGNDSDVDSQSLTAALVSGPAHGALTLNANGSFSYTPAASYSGLDSFTYKANDGAADSNVATMTITVTTAAPQGPITSNVMPTVVPINTSFMLTATVNDTTTGGSRIASAQYRIAGGPYMAMSAQDGIFDAVIEDVKVNLSSLHASERALCACPRHRRVRECRS